MSSSSSSRAPTPNACRSKVKCKLQFFIPREIRTQRTHLSSHASSPPISLCASKQPAPRVRLWVEQVDVLRASSAMQRQARVQTAVAQTLKPHFGVKVQRSHVLWRKGYVFRSKLLVSVLLLLGSRSDIITMKAFPTSSTFSSNVVLH